VRVIAGSFKGRRLKAPTWDGLRPTSDKLRETLFNILAHRIAGAAVLDLYAGTGAIGIEALSRGAGEVVFVERDRRAQALIADNLRQCGIANGYTVWGGEVVPFLSSADRPAQSFDIIALDPPYAASRAELERVLAGSGDRLRPGGVVILEHARRASIPEAAGRLTRVRTVRSGDSALSFFEASD
jgi:16S rRNA (guanine(966)-N(2))-methyltransferase RsmD